MKVKTAAVSLPFPYIGFDFSPRCFERIAHRSHKPADSQQAIELKLKLDPHIFSRPEMAGALNVAKKCFQLGPI